MRNHVVTEPCLTPMKTPALPCTRDAPWCRALSHIKPGTLATICPVNLVKNDINLHTANQLIITDGSFFNKIEIKFCYPIKQDHSTTETEHPTNNQKHRHLGTGHVGMQKGAAHCAGGALVHEPLWMSLTRRVPLTGMRGWRRVVRCQAAAKRQLGCTSAAMTRKMREAFDMMSQFSLRRGLQIVPLQAAWQRWRRGLAGAAKAADALSPRQLRSALDEAKGAPISDEKFAAMTRAMPAPAAPAPSPPAQPLEVAAAPVAWLGEADAPAAAVASVGTGAAADAAPSGAAGVVRIVDVAPAAMSMASIPASAPAVCPSARARV